MVAEPEFQNHDRDADQEERDEIGQIEGAAAELVGVGAEKDDVAEADRRSGGRQDEAEIRFPLSAVRSGLCHPCVPRVPERIPPGDGGIIEGIGRRDQERSRPGARCGR